MFKIQVPNNQNILQKQTNGGPISIEARKLYFMVECFSEYVFPLYSQIKLHSYRYETKTYKTGAIVFLFPHTVCIDWIFLKYFPFLITIIIQVAECSFCFLVSQFTVILCRARIQGSKINLTVVRSLKEAVTNNGYWFLLLLLDKKKVSQ